MPTLTDLLASPAVAPLLEPRALPASAGPVEVVVLIEATEALEVAAPRSLAVLTRRATAEAARYRLDVALRLAAARGITGLVLSGDAPGELSPTAAQIAERGGVAVLWARPGADLSHLIASLQREVEGDARAALARVHAALTAAADAEAASADAEGIVFAAATALGTPLALREPLPGERHVPVVVAGSVEASVCAAAGAGPEAAVELVLHVTALVVARAITAQRHAEEIPARSRAELLGELLTADARSDETLARRARAAGIPVDGWHAVVLLDVRNLVELAGDEVRAFELSQAVGRVAIESARAAGATWHRTRLGSALVLVRTSREDPGSLGASEAADTAARMLRRLTTRVPGLLTLCGVGGVHAGAAGLRASAAEARAAVGAARLADRSNAPVRFDEVGLRRTLIEWYGSDSAREAVQSVLAPLNRLGDRKAATAIHTLEAYLDNQGSLARTAEALHLHRNAVSYRIKRIFALLDVDPADADQRLLLHLACRARALS